MILIDLAASLNGNMKISGKCVNHRGTYAVKSAAGFIRVVIKFTARVKGCEDKPLRADTFLMHPYGNASAVIRNGGRSVGFQSYFYDAAKACQMLVHRIVHNFVNQVV